MERDIRRDRGQWRGCYAFKDIICDGDQPGAAKRDGGLKMGQNYYYYYELNGHTEVHDPAKPTTNTCPFLPGQTVNTLHVPVQKPEHRKRSASLTSLRKANYMTMNPQDKYATPRAAPSVPACAAAPAMSALAKPRIGTAPTLQHERLDTRSPSPTHSTTSSTTTESRGWSAKRLFRIKHKERGRGRERSHSAAPAPAACPAPIAPSAMGLMPLVASATSSAMVATTLAPETSSRADDQSSIMSSESSRSRDISPDAIIRYFTNDVPLPVLATDNDSRPTIAIPEDIVEENEAYDDDSDEEDDDNLVTSAVSEVAPYQTILSPPPFQRAHSGSSNSSFNSNPAIPKVAIETVDTLQPRRYGCQSPPPSLPSINASPALISGSAFDLSPVTSRWSLDSSDDEAPIPITLQPDMVEGGNDGAGSTFYDDSSDGEEDDPEAALTKPTAARSNSSGAPVFQQTKPLLSTYSLPRSSDGERLKTARSVATLGSSGNGSNLLGAPIDDGFDPLVNELAWMADYMRGKGI